MLPVVTTWYLLVMESRQVNLRLPAELLERLDEARGDVPRNRWIVRALEFALRGGATEITISEDVLREARENPGSLAREAELGRLEAERLERFGGKP